MGFNSGFKGLKNRDYGSNKLCLTHPNADDQTSASRYTESEQECASTTNRKRHSRTLSCGFPHPHKISERKFTCISLSFCWCLYRPSYTYSYWTPELCGVRTSFQWLSLFASRDSFCTNFLWSWHLFLNPKWQLYGTSETSTFLNVNVEHQTHRSSS